MIKIIVIIIVNNSIGDTVIPVASCSCQGCLRALTIFGSCRN